MDSFDSIENYERSSRSTKSSGMFWNIMTVLVLLSTFGVGSIFLNIFMNPYSAINPFPPPTRVTPYIPSTETATPVSLLPPTWTPTATLEPTETPTPRPTSTPLFTETPFEFPTATPEPEIDPNGMAFVLDQGSPKALPNIFYQERGCNWMGVGGIVADLSGSPIKTGILVELGGTLGGKQIQLLTITTPNGLSSRSGFRVRTCR
jgi:hypothetical protein